MESTRTNDNDDKDAPKNNESNDNSDTMKMKTKTRPKSSKVKETESQSDIFLIKKELWKKKGMIKKANQTASERSLIRKKYMFDKNGNPRKTFRRMNCLGKTGSIGSLFGGQGTHPWPRPTNIPEFNGGVNPFIKENELFVAGRSDC